MKNQGNLIVFAKYINGGCDWNACLKKSYLIHEEWSRHVLFARYIICFCMQLRVLFVIEIYDFKSLVEVMWTRVDQLSMIYLCNIYNGFI